MPAITYLSLQEESDWASVPDDKDINELLQELRKTTGENWLIGRHQVAVRHGQFWKRLFRKPAPLTSWTLYADCHGEWQVMSLVTPHGSSIFHLWEHSREAIMNFMLGYIGAWQRVARTMTPTKATGQE